MLSTWFRSAAASLAEWAGMHKRLEITVKNPGYEGTDHALGLITVDFEDQEALEKARYEMHRLLATQAPVAIILQNEKGEEQGFNTNMYVSHRIADADDWKKPNWLLPESGVGPTDRS
jgi:hypothetical protein